MTEEQWLAATEPQAMLAWLRTAGGDYEQRYRLFACACVRRIWPLLTDARSRVAVEMTEDHADGRLHYPSVSQAARAAGAAVGELHGRITQLTTPSERRLGQAQAKAASAAYAVLNGTSVFGFITSGGLAASGAASAAAVAVKLAARVTGAAGRPSAKKERHVQSRLLRCIFGNPFRPPVHIAERTLAWNDGCVKKLAQAIYEERRFQELPILADALEESGYDDQEMLGHCREQRSTHVRGCWVLDLLLGKE